MFFGSFEMKCNDYFDISFRPYLFLVLEDIISNLTHKPIDFGANYRKGHRALRNAPFTPVVWKPTFSTLLSYIACLKVFWSS